MGYGVFLRFAAFVAKKIQSNCGDGIDFCRDSFGFAQSLPCSVSPIHTTMLVATDRFGFSHRVWLFIRIK